jgi:hypothetical protein
MKVSDYLASLGASADEVAESLRKQGVNGRRCSKASCPILNGIYKACPNYWTGLRITGGRKREDGNWNYHASLDDSQIMDPTLPQAVMNFIGNFDCGEYPDLESRLSVGPEK